MCGLFYFSRFWSHGNISADCSKLVIGWLTSFHISKKQKNKKKTAWIQLSYLWAPVWVGGGNTQHCGMNRRACHGCGQIQGRDEEGHYHPVYRPTNLLVLHIYCRPVTCTHINQCLWNSPVTKTRLLGEFSLIRGRVHCKIGMVDQR